MKTLKTYLCKIPSNVDCLCSAVKDIIAYLNDTYGTIDESVLFEVKVILNELILNAIKHGNKECCEKLVKISAGVTMDERAFIIIEDEGDGCLDLSGFNEDRCRDEPIDFFNLKETGRGIIIVNSLCDRVKFNKKGNKIVILKKLKRQSTI